MGLFALLHALMARKAVIALAAVMGLATALVVGVSLPTDYVAEARVQLDAKQKNALTGNFEPRERITEFLGQQVAVASSRLVALAVYDQLTAEGALSIIDFEDRFRDATDGGVVAGSDPRLWAGDQLLKKLEIDANAIESTLTIGYRDADPGQSARIANAFANAYMDAIIEKRGRRAALTAANFSQETDVLESAVEEARKELRKFRNDAGIIGDGVSSVEAIEVDLAELTKRLAQVRAEHSEMRALLVQARAVDRSALLALPLPKDLVAGIRAQERLARLDAEMQPLLQRYDRDYAPLRDVREEVAALETTILQSIAQRADYAARRIAALERETTEKTEEVLRLRERKEEYDTLRQKLEASRAAYELVANRSLQEALQSRVDIVDVFMLSRAVPPTKSTAPPLAGLGVLGLFGGLAFGAAAAIALETVEGKARSARAIAQTLRAPVLTRIEFGAPRKRLRERTVARAARQVRSAA